MADLRLPNITATTEAGQLQQIKSYLYQLTNQLNFALKETENTISTTYTKLENKVESAGQTTAEDRFYELKDLIIKSADIIDEYCEVITKKLEGTFVAQSDFGTFEENYKQYVIDTGASTTKYYDSLKKITGYVGLTEEEREKLGEDDVICEFVKDDFYIRTGYLDDNHSIGGIEIGQMTASSTGERKAFARFTPDELYFYSRNSYDANGDPIKLATFGQNDMMIRDATIQNNLTIGNYIVDTTHGGVAFRWGGV